MQEGSEQALYFDADILDVQRRRHDVRGCRCRFWVRYRHDQTEVGALTDVASFHFNSLIYDSILSFIRDNCVFF